MSDYKYDSYDTSALQVAFANLRKAEEQGFWMGLVLGSPLGVYLVSNPRIQHKFAAGPVTKVASALLVGSLVYGARIFSARQDYNERAAKVNRKYSVILNKAMTFE